MVCLPTNRITTHPGVLLLEQIREMGLSVNRVARDIRLPATRLHEIVHQRRGVDGGDGDRARRVFQPIPRVLDDRADGL